MDQTQVLDIAIGAEMVRRGRKLQMNQLKDVVGVSPNDWRLLVKHGIYTDVVIDRVKRWMNSPSTYKWQ